MDQKIVLLGDDFKPIGVAQKLASHHSNTPLHLAFSCYVFNDKNQLLITKRSSTKKVWPDVWTNSFCGHPTPKESLNDAILRRAKYELGMTNLSSIEEILPDYRYTTPPYNGIIENEFCPVYVAYFSGSPVPNVDEVAELQWVRVHEVLLAIDLDPHFYSYWFKDQLSRLIANNYFRKIAGLAK